MFGLGSTGSLGMGVMMSLEDDFTGSADKIENSMKRLEGVTETMTKKVTSGLAIMKKGMLTAGVGLALLVPLGASVEKAAELSDQMADVRKTTGMLSEEVVGFRNELMEFDTRTNTSDLLDIAKIGGQIGVAKEQLKGFTASVDQAAVALGDEFTGGVEQVAKSLGTIKNIFKETKEMDYGTAMTKIGSAINSLGAAGQATGPNIANFVNRIGQLGELGPTINEALALGATLEEVGIEGQVGAGGLTALITEVTELSKQHNRLKDFALQMNMTEAAAKNLFNASRADFVIALAKSFKGLAPYEIGNRLKGLGLAGSEVQRVFGSLAGATDLYADRLRIVNEQMALGTSLQEEFNIKNQTPGAIIDKMGKAWSDTVTIIGEAAMPVFMTLYGAFTKIIQAIKSFAQSEAGKFIVKLLAISGILLTLAGTIMIVKGAFMALQVIMPLVGASVWGALAPILPIVLPLIAAGWLLKESWSSFMDVLDGKAQVADGFLGFLQRIGAALWTVKQVWDSWNGQTFDLGGREGELQAMGILEQMKALATWVVRLKALWDGFAEGIGNAFGFIVNQFKGLGKDLGSLFNYLGINVGKLGIKLDWLKSIGKVLAYVIAGPLMAAMVVIRVTISAVALVVGGLTAVFYGLYSGIKSAIMGIYELFTSFNLIDVIVGAWDSLVGIGSTIIRGIFDGIKAGWGMITEWLGDKLSFMGDWNPFGSPSPDLVPVGISPSGGGVSRRITDGVAANNNLRNNPSNNFYNTTNNTNGGPGKAVVNMQLDGETIGKAVVDFQNRNDSLY